MGKKFTKKVTKKSKTRATHKDFQDFIEKEFVDSKGNKSKLRFDFRPHSPKEPTIRTYVDYGEENKE